MKKVDVFFFKKKPVGKGPFFLMENVTVFVWFSY